MKNLSYLNLESKSQQVPRWGIRIVEGKLLFTWEDNSNEGIARPDDKAILVAYFSEIK